MRNLHSEWRFLHSNVFQKRFELFFWKTNSTDSFLHSEWRNLHSEWGFLHLFFSHVFWFFFEKKTLQRVFSVQNGEISILNGDFSIHMFLRSVLFFFKTSPQRFFSIQVFFLRVDLSIFLKHISTYNFLHPEWRFGDFSIHFFQKRFLLKNKLHK